MSLWLSHIEHLQSWYLYYISVALYLKKKKRNFRASFFCHITWQSHHLVSRSIEWHLKEYRNHGQHRSPVVNCILATSKNHLRLLLSNKGIFFTCYLATRESSSTITYQQGIHLQMLHNKWTNFNCYLATSKPKVQLLISK